MPSRRGGGTILFGSLFLLCLTGALPADKATRSEYKIKAALVYKLIQFTEWPERPPSSGHTLPGKQADVQDPDGAEAPPPPFLIGICGLEGEPDLLELFLVLEKKALDDRPIRIVTIDRKTLREKHSAVLDGVDALYLPGTLERGTIARILARVKTKPVLTFGEADRFLEEGGDIRFLREGNHIRFEINLAALKTVSLKIKTAVLKLAKRVIKEEKKKA